MRKRKFSFLKASIILSLGVNPTTFHTSHFNEGKVATTVDHQNRQVSSEPTVANTVSLTGMTYTMETLNEYYNKNLSRLSAEPVKIDDFIQGVFKQGLNKDWKSKSRGITKVILQQSKKYQFDPIFLVAIIENESNFNPEAIGTSGEIGLMQIRPETAEWIAEKLHISWKGAESLFEPETNIRLGSAYLAFLRDTFNSKSQLYLAAYNMGTANVHKLMSRQTIPHTYSQRVFQKYRKLYARLTGQLAI